MKKLLTKPICDGRRLLSLLTILLAFSGSVAWGAVGDTFEKDDLKLKFEVLTETEDDMTVSVTAPMWSSPGELVIPDAVEYDGKTYLVTEIEDEAFYNSRFDNIKLGANIHKIGRSAFCYGSLSEVLLNDGLQEIGKEAFTSCRGLKTVNIPSTVNRLGGDAFNGCINLKAVTIAEGTQLERISYGVFANTRIETITLPEGIKFVNDDAFGSSLVTLNLPSTFQDMGNGYSFLKKCTALKVINIASDNPDYKSIDGIVYSKDGETLLYCPKGISGTVAIANGTKKVEQLAFYQLTQITQIDIPDGVTDFDVLGFDAERLETINIPSTLTEVWIYGYKHPKLTTINVSEGNPALRSVGGVLYSKDMTTLLKYPAGRTDTEYALPDVLKKIDRYAFANTKNLTTLVTNSSLDSIGDYAFYKSGLTQVTLNAPLQYIGEKAFSESQELTTLSLPASLKFIDKKAFDSCYRLENITFGTYDFMMDGIPFLNTPWFDIKKVEESGDGCIYFGPNLIAYVNEDKTTPVDIVVKEGTTNIGSYAFNNFSDSKNYNYDHPNIKSITLPTSLKRIGTMAFRYLDVTSLTIPDAVEEMDEYAIGYMSALESLHIGKGLKKYGGKYKMKLIEGCRRLATITVDPENTFLQSVDNMLVRNNDTLIYIPFPTTDIVVPEGIKSVTEEAFPWYQDEMKERTFTIGKDVESVPVGMMFNHYTVAEGNPYYKVADEMLLHGDTLLVAIANQERENLVIPATVKRIGDRVMNWNQTLKTLKLADCTEVVGEAAFEGCINLESVDMGKSLTTLEDYAFYECDNLKELLMPATFRKMYGKSFMGDIKKVTFTAVGEIEYDPSISWSSEEPVTVSFPCVSTVKVVTDDSYFDPNRIALNPYACVYSNGEVTPQESYDESTMTGNELYFTTVDDADDRVNYIVVANNSSATPETPSDDAPSKAMAKAPAASTISARCAHLKIKDGVAFSTPISFTADEATLERSVGTNWSAIALPFTADVPADCQVVELTEENEVTESSADINFTTLTDKMLAGRGYLIKAADGTASSISATNATVEPSVMPEADAQFIGNIGGAIVFDDAFRSQTENVGYEFYGFSQSLNQFVKFTDTAICGTFCAYLKLRSGINAATLPFVVAQHTPTGIGQSTVETQNYKNIYTLGGVKLSAPRKGINIVDGKKVLMR